jgi:HEAT repeat protein
MRKSWFHVAVLQCACAVVGLAQVGTGGVSESSQLCSGLTGIEQCLTLHGVSLRKDALLSALQSEDPEIVRLAAGELAVKHVKDAAPQIERLLDAESDPAAKIGLAQDLTMLGDARGIQELQRFCDDRTLPIITRLSGAEVLRVQVGQKSCPELIISGIQDEEPVARVLAISMIPHFQELRSAARVQALVAHYLSDPDAAVRLEAADTIRIMGDAAAVPALQAALLKETDPGVRNSMAASLKNLQAKRP